VKVVAGNDYKFCFESGRYQVKYLPETGYPLIFRGFSPPLANISVEA